MKVKTIDGVKVEDIPEVRLVRATKLGVLKETNQTVLSGLYFLSTLIKAIVAFKLWYWFGLPIFHISIDLKSMIGLGFLIELFRPNLTGLQPRTPESKFVEYVIVVLYDFIAPLSLVGLGYLVKVFL